MKKRLIIMLFTLAAVLTTLQASAAMYIVGNEPFGGWLTNSGAQMTDNGDGTYSYTAIIGGNTWFVFADGLTESNSDWNTFNSTYRIGPTSNYDEVVTADTWTATHKPSDNGAFKFTGNGSSYTITFDKTNMRFKISGGNLYGFMQNGIYYNITNMSTPQVEVTKGSTYGNNYSGDLIIPSSVTYDGVTYEVTAIGSNAFQSCHDLTSVSIPTSVTTIKESAFYYCTSLTEVEIPESVTMIEDWNFYKSDALTKVTLPSTLYYLGSQCFGVCPNLNKVVCKATTPPALSTGCFSPTTGAVLYVPESAVSDYQADTEWSSRFSTIEAIRDYDFIYNNLKYVITSSNTAKVVGHVVASPSGSYSIPDVVTVDGVTYRITEVGQEAFFNCTGITKFSLGPNVEIVESYAFYGCSGIEILKLSNVKEIQDCAFGDCASLTSVTIPSSVTHIGLYGFGGCGLTTITIPATVEFLGDRVLNNCPSLTAINVASDNPNYTSVNGVMFSKDMTELLAYPVGKNVTSYSVPEGVTRIRTGALEYNHILQSVTLPTTLTNVDYIALAYSPSLTSVTCLAQTPPVVGIHAFESTIENSGLTLTVPRGCKSAYQAADGWKDFPNIQEMYYDFYEDGIYYNITGPNTVAVTCEARGSKSYSGTVNVPEMVNHDGKSYTVTAIGSYAFEYCNSLTAVTLPSSITEIGYAAFYSDFNLTSINLPENLTEIGIYAFYACTSLGNVEIPASVTWLGTYAFCGCSSFTEIVIPNAITEIDYGAFYSCSSLTKVTLGSSLNDIDGDAFKNCTALETIIIHASTPPTISSNTFMDYHYSNVHLMVPKGSLSAYQSADYWKNFTNITSLAYDFEKDGVYYNYLGGNTVEVTYMTTDYNSYSGDVNIPETVTYNGVTYTVTQIGYSAFRNCASLTSVTMPNTIQTIGNYAFYHCDALTAVDIPNSVTTIGNNAFWLCLSLEEAIIPNSVTTIGSMAFRNCTAMKRVVIGENVTSIGSTCFIYNPNITEVICLAATPPTLNDPESGSMTTFQTAVYTNAVLRVPYGSHEAYRNDANWGKFVNIVSEDVIGSGLQGDVNDDGNVNIKDVTDLINYLLTDDASGINLSSADVNGNGSVNISDVTELINILLTDTGSGTPTGSGKTNYLINSVPFTMIKVDSGTFMMGSEGVSLATPVHQVTLTDYYIGETEVTQALWQAVMSSNPSSNKSDVNLPVENMKWDDCQTFTTKLSKLTGKNFRLPTEAEWEFAARGGNKSQGYTYPGSNNLDEVAWYQDNSGGKTHLVGTKAPNELGLYDMSGNVFEWIQDYYGNYTSEPQVNPQGPTTGENRVCRSAGYNRPSSFDWFKCAGRTYDSPSTNAGDTGLRLAMNSEMRGDVNCDGVIDENDYAELWLIYQGQTPLSTYAADVNGDGSIIFDYYTNIQNSDNTALVRILYNGLMKTWNGYPYNNSSDPKYDVNGDGEVNAADLNCVVDILFGYNYTGGDLDNDGAVNWRDACILHVVLMKLNEIL